MGLFMTSQGPDCGSHPAAGVGILYTIVDIIDSEAKAQLSWGVTDVPALFHGAFRGLIDASIRLRVSEFLTTWPQ